jgi:hypothetical protein
MRTAAIIANFLAIISHVSDGSVDAVDAILCAVCGAAIGGLLMTIAVDHETEKAGL